MVVAGIFKTGIENYDRVNALVDIGLIQRLNNWTAKEIGGYEIFIKDFEQADSVSNRIFEKLPQKWNSRSITEIYGNIFDWLNLMNNHCHCYRDHGAGCHSEPRNLPDHFTAGKNPYDRIVKIHGFKGQEYSEDISLSWCTDYIRRHSAGKSSRLADLLASEHYGFITLPEDTYFISTAAVRINWQQVLWVNLGTFVICFVVLLIPSFFIIKRLSPVKAIAFN